MTRSGPPVTRGPTSTEGREGNRRPQASTRGPRASKGGRGPGEIRNKSVSGSGTQGCAGSEWREGSRAEDSPGLQGNLKRKHVRRHHQGPELGGPTHRRPAGDQERLSVPQARSERGLSGLPGNTDGQAGFLPGPTPLGWWQVPRGVRTHTTRLPASGHGCPKGSSCLPWGAPGEEAAAWPSHPRAGPPLHHRTKQGPQWLTRVAHVTITPCDTVADGFRQTVSDSPYGPVGTGRGGQRGHRGPQGGQQLGSRGEAVWGGSAVLGQPGSGGNGESRLAVGHRHGPEPEPSTDGESAGLARNFPE